MNKIEISQQVFDNLIYSVRSMLQIIATKELTPNEIIKMRYLTKLMADDIKETENES